MTFMPTKDCFTITIDGPAAAGKGTLCRGLSKTLGFPHLDTGLLYRITAVRSLAGEDPISAAQTFRIEDMTLDGLRTAEVSQEASRVSAIPEVRAALLDFQKTFAARPGGAILDGRDTGTQVCPTARLKLFVTASDEARAGRRLAELLAAGAETSFEEVLSEMRQRDQRDATRAVAPMRPSDDAVIIDTSDMTSDAVLKMALDLVAERQAA